MTAKVTKRRWRCIQRPVAMTYGLIRALIVKLLLTPPLISL